MRRSPPTLSDALGPIPAGPHTFVASGLGVDLGVPFDRGRGGPGGGYFADEPELHLGGDVLVPDLAAWRVERLPPQARTHAYFDVAPDWESTGLRG
jgi:hypothetical protein